MLQIKSENTKKHVTNRVETKMFFHCREKRKLSVNEQVFAKFCLRKFLFLLKFSQKVFVYVKAFANVFAKKFCFCENENFCESFRLRVKGKFCCDKLPLKFYILTSILVHVYGYCLICFDTLSGFDHPVRCLYNKMTVPFVLKQDPDLLVLITQ
jgi:hypothetical protein